MSPLTPGETEELARLEAQFDEKGGWEVLSRGSEDPMDDAYWDNIEYAGGSDAARRLIELRERRGDGEIEVQVQATLTIRVTGELMSEPELRAAIEAGAIERDVERCLRLNLAFSEKLGYSPDGARAAWLDELLSVDDVRLLPAGGLFARTGQ